MKIIIFLTCFIFPLFSFSQKEGDRLKVPSHAKFVIEKEFRNEGKQDKSECEGFHLNLKDIKKIFSEYRIISPQDRHHKYLWLPCYVEGQIVLDNAKYFWRIRSGNLLDTNFPDGKDKILGGAPSDVTD